MIPSAGSPMYLERLEDTLDLAVLLPLLFLAFLTLHLLQAEAGLAVDFLQFQSCLRISRMEPAKGVEGEVKGLFCPQQHGQNKEVEGDGEKEADGDSHEDAKQFVVGIEAAPVAGGAGDEDWEGEAGSDAFGSRHLEADRPEHDKDAEGEDDLTLDTIGLLVVDGASVNESVEEESDGESEDESTEEAVEDFEDARAAQGVGIAPLDALELELEKEESQASDNDWNCGVDQDLRKDMIMSR